MAPHELRVIEEKKELEEKLSKLNDFLSSPARLKLGDKETELLVTQASCMNEYVGILAERIALFQAGAA